MIFDKARMAKLSGLMTESKGAKGPTDGHEFGGGDKEGDPWLDGEVSTADHDLHEGEDDEAVMPEAGEAEEGMKHVEARRKKHHDDDEMDEASLREMIRKEMAMAKKEVEETAKEEEAVREAVRREIRSVLRSRGVALGGTGFGFKR